MNFAALVDGQPAAIFGLGYSNPSLVGLYCILLLLIFVFLGLRVVFAATVVGMIGLVELIGWSPALTNIGSIPHSKSCLLYTSPSPRDATLSRMPSSA